MARESQLIAQLLIQSPSSNDWHQAIIEENLLQKPSQASSKRNAATIRKRIASLGTDFLSTLEKSNNNDAKQLMLVATLIDSPILIDFIKHVLLEARRLYRTSLNQDDWLHFWEDRTRVIPELSELSQSSVYKIGQVVFKILFDAGYIDSTKDKNIQNVYLSSELRTILINMNREDILRVMEP